MKNFQPDLKESAIAIIFVVLTFLLYYLQWYPVLSERYENSFWSGAFERIDTASLKDKNIEPCTGVQGGNGTQDLTINALYPTHLADFMEQEIHLRFQNNTRDALPLTLRVLGKVIREDTEIEQHIEFRLPLSNGEYTKFTIPGCSVHFVKIYMRIPGIDETLDGYQVRLMFWLRGHLPQLEDQLLHWSGRRETDQSKPTEFLYADISSEQVFRHSAIRTLLLPPWNNGLIPIYVLALVWATSAVIRVSIPKQDPEKKAGFWRKLFNILMPLLLFGLVSYNYIKVTGIWWGEINRTTAFTVALESPDDEISGVQQAQPEQFFENSPLTDWFVNFLMVFTPPKSGVTSPMASKTPTATATPTTTPAPSAKNDEAEIERSESYVSAFQNLARLKQSTILQATLKTVWLFIMEIIVLWGIWTALSWAIRCRKSVCLHKVNAMYHNRLTKKSAAALCDKCKEYDDYKNSRNEKDANSILDFVFRSGLSFWVAIGFLITSWPDTTSIREMLELHLERVLVTNTEMKTDLKEKIQNCLKGSEA